MSGLSAGPAVSLNGSPTVSPITAAACAGEFLPPWLPSSTIFFALSHAPPVFDKNTASSTPVAIAPARKPASGPTPSPKPTATGAEAASRPGVASSRSESRVQMSTTLPYSGRAAPVMIPGWERNWRRTSCTIAPAARVTASISRPENRNTVAPPRITPTRVTGEMMSYTSIERVTAPTWATSPPTPASEVRTVSAYEPNSAVAASTAVEIAMPLVIALVVLPTASRSVSTCAPWAETSPDICAMPCALSLTGPNVSIATITPTVVSSPHPASATKNKDSTTDPPESRKTAQMAAAIVPAVYADDSNPTPIPDSTTVAAPVKDVRATCRVGLDVVPVK